MKIIEVTPVTAKGCASEPFSPYGKLSKAKRLMAVLIKGNKSYTPFGVVQTKRYVNPKPNDIIKLGNKTCIILDVINAPGAKYHLPQVWCQESINFSNMKKKPPTPKVGVAVIIRNPSGKVLMGLRKGSHAAGLWSVPGGHMEIGESFLDVCKREVMEEVGLTVTAIKQLTFTNCIFPKEGLHYVTLFFEAVWDKTSKPEIKEPDKMERMAWVYPVNIRNRNIMPGLRQALPAIFPELQKLK